MARKTGPTPRTVELVLDRSGGLCEVCGFTDGQQIHHRKPRGMGGTRDAAINSTANLLHVCYPCHRAIESDREKSLENGHLVRNAGIPLDIPVMYRFRMKQLDNEGNAILCRGSKSMTAFTARDKY